MTISNEADGLVEPTTQTHNLNEFSALDPSARDTGIDRSHLNTILAFVNREIDQSATILHDFARNLSDEFCALSEAEDHDIIKERVLAATIALQSEDRVQQRLLDLRKTLSLLEQALLAGEPDVGADLDHAIIGQLNLDEIRFAFAQSVGMTSAVPAPADPAKAPSIGDIDLF